MHVVLPSSIILKFEPIDILVIMLGNNMQLKNTPHVCMVTGTGNHEKFTEVSKIYEESQSCS